MYKLNTLHFSKYKANLYQIEARVHNLDYCYQHDHTDRHTKDADQMIYFGI